MAITATKNVSCPSTLRYVVFHSKDIVHTNFFFSVFDNKTVGIEDEMQQDAIMPTPILMIIFRFAAPGIVFMPGLLLIKIIR